MAEDIMEFDRLRAAYIDFWKRALDTKGIATRYDFWVPMIANAVVCSILVPLIGYLGFLACVAVAIPSVTVSLRRLNDLERDWTHILVALIPLVGQILFLYWMTLPGHSLPAEHSKLKVDPEIESELAAARAELDDAMGTSEADKVEGQADAEAAADLDAMLGAADAARREEEDREATAAAARDLDTMFSNDVDDDPLAREIAKAAANKQ